MIDIKEQNDEIPPAQAAAGMPVAVDCDDPNRPKPQMSLGEKRYNNLVYRGMNYWLNLGISLAVTDFFVHGRGKGFFDSNVKRISKGLTATGLRARVAKRTAEIMLGTFTLNSGGNILLIPTKLLEDRKRPFVHWLNKKMGVSQIAPDGHEETSDEIYIEQEQPRQSWGRMVWRRTLGWAATTIAGLGIDTALAQKLPVPQGINGDTITHVNGQKIFTDAMVKGGSAVLNSGFIPGGKAVAASPAAQRYMGYAALDWIYTIITSKILHMTNGAHKEREPGEINDECSPPAPVDKQPPAYDLQPQAAPESGPAQPAGFQNRLGAKPRKSHAAQVAAPPEDGVTLGA
ncbi:MAG: hypothetical protein KGI29_00165 [Pseudomonadota bacterium]|nr:hypothetical protein [Pseudomonadota bacterium]MDE3038538.1 hypothetical protein [Pseudomonadota bacterium]